MLILRKFRSLSGLNPYKFGLFWRFLWWGGGGGGFRPIHNFGTINDDAMKLSTEVLHQQRNKLTSSFIWWRHYFFCVVIMFVKLWPDTMCHSKSVYNRCIAYCKMYLRFWQGKVSVYHISDGFPVIHQITRKILLGNPVKIRFFENSGKSEKSESWRHGIFQKYSTPQIKCVVQVSSQLL